MRTALVSIALACAAACGGNDGGSIDAGDGGGTGSGDGGGDPSMLTCAQIAERLRLFADATSDSCQSASECSAVGFPVDWAGPTCNCGLSFANSCGGIAVNWTAWSTNTAIDAFESEWQTRCLPMGAASGAPGLCDCSWEPSSIDCVNGHCYSDPWGRNCLVFDAGVR
jgi:hypothetical protein